MSFDVFLNFDGDCAEALDFYAEVFNVKKPDQIMTYGQNPGGSDEADRDRILYAVMPIHGCNVMFSDCPSDSEYVKGNNFALTLGFADEGEIARIYHALAHNGTVRMELGKTFFSDCYAMVVDKFGITWQLSKAAG